MQTDALTEQYAKLNAKAGEQEKELAEKATRIASLQGELDAGKQYAEELKEQVGRVTKEALELRSAMEQDGRYRNSLEAQLRAEQEQIGQLNNKVAELQTEHAQLEIRLQEVLSSRCSSPQFFFVKNDEFRSKARFPRSGGGE